MKKILFVFGLVALAAACTPKIVEVIDEPEPEVTVVTPDPNAMSADALTGKELFATKCTKCHEAKPIKVHTKEQWVGILANMIPKAKLDEVKGAQVTAYVNWELNQ